MVADVVEVVVLFLAVLDPAENAADVGLALGARSKGCLLYTSANCGAEAKVPFQPRDDRPVYCSDCFAKMKESY